MVTDGESPTPTDGAMVRVGFPIREPLTNASEVGPEVEGKKKRKRFN
jgi:hypothetical protein